MIEQAIGIIRKKPAIEFKFCKKINYFINQIENNMNSFIFVQLYLTKIKNLELGNIGFFLVTEIFATRVCCTTFYVFEKKSGLNCWFAFEYVKKYTRFYKYVMYTIININVSGDVDVWKWFKKLFARVQLFDFVILVRWTVGNLLNRQFCWHIREKKELNSIKILAGMRW